MKQNALFTGILIATLWFCPPSGAQESSAVAAAHREEMEINFKRMNSRMEQLEESLRSQQQRIASFDAEIHTLRSEVDRLKTRNESAATQESIKRLADKIEEVDKKRIADNELILSQLKALGKGLSKAVQPRDTYTPPAPAKTETSDQTSPPEKSWTYKIKDGDTLSRIIADLRAQKINISQKQVMEANPKIDWRRLQIGQEIIIPQPTQ